MSGNDEVTESMPSAISVSTPRRVGRCIGLTHVTVEGLTRPSYTKLKNIHEVVCYNIWVDLIGLHISLATEDQFYNSSRYPYFALRMRNGLPEDLLKMSEDLTDRIYELWAKDRIMVFVRTMTYEHSVAYLDNCDSARFYREMINNQICFVRDLRVLAHRTNESAGIERTCKRGYMIKSPSSRAGRDIFAAYSHFTNLNEDRLVFFLKILQKFRASIGVAALARHLPRDLLATIRLRLQEFDQRDLYLQACSDVSWALPKESRFVADSESWWSVTHCR